jgi:hypothetical protein
VECSRIKALNEAVRELGKEKVDVMLEMKDFRTKIHAINWETQCLEFKAQEVRECMYVYIHVCTCRMHAINHLFPIETMS